MKIGIAVVISCVMALLLVAPAGAAARKSATLTVTFDADCRAVSTVSWTGYQVDHIRHIFYRDTTLDWFTTTDTPKGKTGTAVSPDPDPNPAHVSETWAVHVILRTVGGGRLAELDATAVAPAVCP